MWRESCKAAGTSTTFGPQACLRQLAPSSLPDPFQLNQAAQSQGTRTELIIPSLSGTVKEHRGFGYS